MKNKIVTFFKELSIPEESGKKIGLFRICLAILGGLIISFLSLSLLVFIVPLSLGESLVISLFFQSFVWAILSLWIVLSHTKLIALLRVVIPSILILIIIIFI